MGLFDSLTRKKNRPQESAVATSSSDNVAQAEPTLPEPAPLPELSTLFPYPVDHFHGSQIEIDLYRLRKDLQGSGTYPVIIGDRDSAMRLLNAFDAPYDYDAQMALSRRTIVEDWFRAQLEKKPLPEQTVPPVPAGIVPMTKLQAGFDPKGHARPKVYISTLPTPHSSSVPIYLRFGDWNECPPAWVHTMLARYWREIYGAEIAVISEDTIEFTVTEPPATDEDALALAAQQFLYCSDIVTQGVGSVEGLAKILRNSTRWYFWWD